MTLRLVASEDDFAGLATAHIDVLQPGEQTGFHYAAARLRPTDCPE